MNKKQIERVNKITKRSDKFEYGLGQADKDIKFLLRMVDQFCEGISVVEKGLNKLDKLLNDFDKKPTK